MLKISNRLLILICFVSCVILPGMAQTYIQYVDSADNYIKRENWRDAERMTIAALKAKPANKLNYLLWSNLGDIRTRMEDYDGALQAFEIALASAPKKELILNNRAYTYLQMGETDKAYEDINEALRLDSIQEWPLKMRGIINLGKSKYADAEKDFESLKKHFPANAAAYSGLGKIEAIKGNGETAMSLFEKSLELEQSDDTWFYLILINIETDNLPKAKEHLLIALKRYPRCGNLYLLRGLLHKKNYENTEADLDKNIALDYGADPHLVEQYLPKIKK